MADFVISLQDSVDTSKVVELQIGNYILGAPGAKGDKGDTGDVTPEATAAKNDAQAAAAAAANSATSAAASALDAGAAGTAAASALTTQVRNDLANNSEDVKGAGMVGYSGSTVKDALDKINNGTATDAGALTGEETVPMSRGAGLLQKSLAGFGAWLFGTFLGFLQAGIGAVARSVLDKLRDSVSIKDFGAIGDGTFHPLSERFATLALAQAVYPHAASLTQSIDWAAIQMAVNTAVGRRVYAPKGVYVLTDTVEMGENHVFGDGVDHWVPAFVDQIKQESSGTHFRFIGTGAKKYEMRATSDMRLAGGWRTNGNSTNAEDAVYKLVNFMNEDAVGTTPATPKLFSVGVYVKPTTQNWSFRGIRCYPSFDGLTGYNNKTEALADNWDVGLYVNSAEFGHVDMAQFVGYWRMYGGLIGHAPNDAGQYEAGAEHNKFTRSMFQGFRGFGVRGGDYFRCTTVTTSTIELPWTASNPLPSSGGALRSGSNTFTWTGATRSGDKITLTGVTPDPVAAGVAVGTILRNNTVSTGVGGTMVSDCYICGLEHFSKKRSHELGLGIGVSAAIEGNNARGVRLLNNKIATREDVLIFLHEADDWEISGDLEPASALSGATGGRFIASETFPTDPLVTYPAGNTSNLRIYGGYLSGDLDMEPKRTRTNSRFTDAGLFTPNSFLVESASLPSAVRTTVRALKGEGIYFEKEDGTIYSRITGSGNWESYGQLSLGSAANGAFLNAFSGQNLNLRTGTTTRLVIFEASGTIAPGANGTQAFGSTTSKWANIHSVQMTLTPPASATPANNGELVFQKTSDTQLTIKVKGVDGVVRSANIALA